MRFDEKNNTPEIRETEKRKELINVLSAIGTVAKRLSERLALLEQHAGDSETTRRRHCEH